MAEINRAARGLDGASAPGVQRPGARAEQRQSEKAPCHGDVFLKLDRLICARVEEQRGEQTKAE